MNHPMPSNPQSKQVKPSLGVNSTQGGNALDSGYAVNGYENILPIDFHCKSVRLHQDDCLNRLKAFPDGVFDSVITDPPYALVSITKRFGAESSTPCTVKPGASGAYARASAGFMGQKWDTGETAFAVEFWTEVLRVLKPGGHLVAFGGTRTYHRLACAIEDAGFEIRDQLGWCYGTGFPKSHDVALSFEKTLTKRVFHVDVIDGNPVKVVEWVYLDDGAPMVREAPFRHPLANEWAGWGTALKPAWEPICLARKPLVGSVAENVAAYGVGALNIDGCRIAGAKPATTRGASAKASSMSGPLGGQGRIEDDGLGRFPANVLHDGSAEVVAAFPEAAGATSNSDGTQDTRGVYGAMASRPEVRPGRGDTGSAARFFSSHTFTKKDQLCPSAHVSCAEGSLSLQSEVVASVLADAVARSMPGSALNQASYRAPSTSVTPNELKLISETVTGTTLTFAQRSSLGLPPAKLTLSHSPVECVATPKPTGIIEITVSLSKSNGSAVGVTFEITQEKPELGEQASDANPRLHYSAKASKLDRLGSLHPTVKPVDLMRWLVRLVTPAGGLVLDPFAGSGTTGHAAVCEGRRAVLIEREAKFCRDIVQRMNRMDPNGQPKPRKRPAKPRPPDPWAGTLFATAMAARRAQTKVADKACALVQNRAIMEEQAQPSSSPPTTDSTRAVSDDGQARPAMLHAAE